MYCKMKMSHSIYMFGIQIDTLKTLKIGFSKFNNIKLSFFASYMKRSISIMHAY